MLLEPPDRLADVAAAQVHHQVDRPATAFVVMPVEEFGTRYRQRTLLGAPLSPVPTITFRTPLR